MNRRSVIYIVMSVLSGLIALWVYRTQVAEPRPGGISLGTVQTAPVVLAAADLMPGVSIDPSDLEIVEWPAQFALKGSFSSREALADRVVARRIGEGEPLLEPALLPQGELGGLQALIEPNYRAVSVKVNAVVGVSGFIKPGSRVDVLAQLRTIDDQKRVVPISRTILQNVKVLAIDQKFAAVDDTEAALASVVTLQVLPEEAQKLAYAAAEGKLQLALRGHSDNSIDGLRAVVPSDFADPGIVVQKDVGGAVRPRQSIETIRGNNVGRDYL